MRQRNIRNLTYLTSRRRIGSARTNMAPNQDTYEVLSEWHIMWLQHTVRTRSLVRSVTSDRTMQKAFTIISQYCNVRSLADSSVHSRLPRHHTCGSHVSLQRTVGLRPHVRTTAHLVSLSGFVSRPLHLEVRHILPDKAQQRT